ncbi:MAG: hypothetical protein RL497_390, partial [Pseudomonadota bacterium]
EALHLQPGDIDGQRLRVHIRNGKGHKDRFVILPEITYQLLILFSLGSLAARASMVLS